jgi:hypothetical protein
VLPDQPGPTPHLAVAAGKDGKLFIVNRDNMGQFVLNPPDKPPYVDIGKCFCGPSYFEGPDGVGRIVTSGGDSVNIWKVQSSKTAPLASEVMMPASISSTGGGFFTVVSSHGTQANTAIIWAVSRPQGSDTVSLYAFDAAPSNGNLHQLFPALAAGKWATNYSANIVPVVANGQVYVASDKQLAIFGLGSASVHLSP